MEINKTMTVSSGDSQVIETEIAEEIETTEEEVVEETTKEETVEEIEEVTEEAEESTFSESTLSNEILYQLELQNLALEQITETMEESKQTIWEKPIEDYTPTEGLLLIIMYLILAVIIFKLVGGIVCVK